MICYSMYDFLWIISPLFLIAVIDALIQLDFAVADADMDDSNLCKSRAGPFALSFTDETRHLPLLFSSL